MENWTEIRTAFLLGKLGTVSATASAIGVHRATVMRRIESLEGRLGGKLFQRHIKGYTPTELGENLIEVAEQSDNQFRSLLAKARSQELQLEGELVVSCPMLLDHLAFAAIRSFRAQHPTVAINFKASDEVLKLEYGDAHVALTLGDPPGNPDYVVRPFGRLHIGLFRSALTAHDCSKQQPIKDALSDFVKCEEPVYGSSVKQWIDENIREDQIVLSSYSVQSANDAILSGLGAGFLPYFLGRSVNWLNEVVIPRPDWRVPVWMVTHVDVHRTPKVRNFLNALKEVPNLVQGKGRRDTPEHSRDLAVPNLGLASSKSKGIDMVQAS
ncbi:MAG: LysR family transcriptional regulator [Pseudomonadota bacterium]